jgi:type IV secretion system protein VirB9
MSKLLFGMFFLVFTTHNVLAEDFPKRTKYDNRVKNVVYNPDNITRINTYPGIATLIQFSSSEFITESNGGAAIGDPFAWKVNIRGNNVWLRPAAQEPDTNLTIVTNKRTYLFNLVSVKNRNNASWSVRFSYPEPKKIQGDLWDKPCKGEKQNHRYFAKGDNALFPIEVWDNGIFTCMSIRAGADMPVIFKKFPDNTEGLVNSHLENGIIVIHEINPEYRLRLGNLVAGIKTDNLKAVGTKFNGTTNGKVRGIINE